MAEPESADRLVDVLKEIRDELRAVRVELGARGGGRVTSDGIRTQVIDRSASWRAAALAAGAVAGLALVIGVVMRDRQAPARATAVAAMPALPTPAVMPVPAPVVLAAPVAVHGAAPATTPPKSPALTPASTSTRTSTMRPAAAVPADAPAIASLPVSPKKRVKPDLAAKPAAELATDDDATMAFPPPPRRVRVHRLSYGPVGSEPAKL
jgi:hypothetical protein